MTPFLIATSPLKANLRGPLKPVCVRVQHQHNSYTLYCPWYPWICLNQVCLRGTPLWFRRAMLKMCWPRVATVISLILWTSMQAKGGRGSTLFPEKDTVPWKPNVTKTNCYKRNIVGHGAELTNSSTGIKHVYRCPISFILNLMNQLISLQQPFVVLVGWSITKSHFQWSGC